MGPDKEKLIKLLNLTTSANDHEALAAMRKANTILADARVLWDAVIPSGDGPRGGGNTRGQASEDMRARDDKPDTTRSMIDQLLASRMTAKGREFVELIDKFYRAHGYLTSKQRAALIKFYQSRR